MIIIITTTKCKSKMRIGFVAFIIINKLNCHENKATIHKSQILCFIALWNCVCEICVRKMFVDQEFTSFLVGSTPSGRSSVWTFNSFSGGKVSETERGKLPPWVELLELVWFEVGLVKSCAQGVKPFFTFTCYCTFIHKKNIQVILYILSVHASPK